jgi:hypothetical protein
MALKRIVAAVVCTASISCSGGSGGTGMMESPTPTGPTNSGTPTATGDPSNADYIELSGQLASMAANEILQALSGSTASTPMAIGPLELRRPAQTISRTGAYLCCGPQVSTRSYLTVNTAVTVPPATGALGIIQTFMSLGDVDWYSTVANNWRIDLSQMRVTSEMATTGSTVNGSQQMRLQGTFRYQLPNATPKEVTVDVLFQYAKFEDNTPMATGTIGSVNLTGVSGAPLTSPARCSRPREGCGPNANGDAPCTVWPRCPGT